jgi:hypothetical protein
MTNETSSTKSHRRENFQKGILSRMKKYPLVDSVCGKKMSLISSVVLKKDEFTEKHCFEGCSGLVDYLYLYIQNGSPI